MSVEWRDRVLGHVVLDILLLFEVFVLYYTTSDKLHVVGV